MNRNTDNLRNGISKLLRDYRDILLVLAVFIASFSVESYLDMSESIHSLIDRQELFQPDEILFTTFLLFFALVAVLLSRSIKLKNEIIKRNAMENELKAALERTEIMLESMPVATYICRAHGDFGAVHVSDNVERITGHKAQEFISDSSFWAERIHPDQKERILSETAGMLETGRHEHEYLWRIADGSYSWFHDYLRLVKSPDGRGDYIVGMWQDVTERKRALDELETHANKLRESENRYRAIVEHTHDLIVETDAQGVVLYANPQHREIMGYDPQEMAGTSCFQYVHEEDLGAVMAGFQKGSESRESIQTVLYRCKHKNGEWRWLESTGKSFEASVGEVHGVISSRDITDRIEAEQKRKETEERFRALVENSYDMIIEASPDGRFLYINPQFRHLLGYEPEEIINTNIFSNVHHDDKPFVVAEFSRALMNNSAGHAVYRYRHKNSDWRWIESTGNTYKTSAGVIRAVVASRDITERKKMEHELLKAQKLESLGILAGGVAHDVNNMLTIVLGNISIARMNMDPNSRISTRLEESEKAIERATGLTRQLLTFSKAGTPNIRSMSIKELLKESTLFALRGSNIIGQFFINDNLLNVDIDEGQMDQVINNLIINAKQAMLEGGVIDVGAENKTLKRSNGFNLPEGQYVKIHIKDHGIGIPERYLQKIFDPFFTTKEKGSGLGLATSYSIIKKHNGHIAVDSLQGTGTTFTIYLPASENSVRAVEEKIETPVKGKGNILIMDDDKLIRDVLGAMLTELGYNPQYAQNSSEAIKIYNDSIQSRDKFDAVILDLTIPGDIGGWETLKELHAIDPKVKAIMSSGYSEDWVLPDYEEIGFHAFVAKPYNVYDMSKVLYEVITGTEMDTSDNKH